MSVLPNQSQVNNSTAFWAPAFGGGGDVGNTLTLSTLTFGVGVDANANNILTQTGTVQIAQVGDSNQLQLGSLGFSAGFPGNEYGLMGNFDNGAMGDITFGDANDALTMLNYQASGLVSSNVSTVIYGHTLVPWDMTVSSLTVSSLTAPGTGSDPNPSFSTVTMNGAVTMGNNTIKLDLNNQAQIYYNAGDSNVYLQAPSTHVIAIGTALAPVNLQIGDTSINMPTAVYIDVESVSSLYVSTFNGASAYNPIFSSITLNTNGQAIQTATSTIVYANIDDLGNQIAMSFPDVSTSQLGIVAANNTDGLGITARNGFCQLAFGGANGFITGCSSINGAVPALTSGVQSDVAALFSTLFAANPSLSTIAL